MPVYLYHLTGQESAEFRTIFFSMVLNLKLVSKIPVLVSNITKHRKIMFGKYQKDGIDYLLVNQKNGVGRFIDIADVWGEQTPVHKFPLNEMTEDFKGHGLKLYEALGYQTYADSLEEAHARLSRLLYDICQTVPGISSVHEVVKL